MVYLYVPNQLYMELIHLKVTFKFIFIEMSVLLMYHEWAHSHFQW